MMILILTSVLLCIAQALGIHPPICTDVYMNITAQAQNRVANNPPKDLYSNLTAVGSFFGQPVAYVNVSATFTIYGQLCRPARASKIPKLQLLVHGSTYDHTYWSALQGANSRKHEDPSWVRAALSSGYHTLAIDRLGQGKSSRPDPVNLVQDPLQVEILHNIVVKIQEQDLLGIGMSSKTGSLVYVGHSFGSGLGVHLAALYPDDFDAMILTGIATVRGNPGPGSLLNKWTPASQAFPKRFPNLADGYLISTNKTARQGLFYSAEADFAPALFERDWKNQGTNLLGEVLTTAEYLVQLPKDYDRPVFIATGDQDAIFCSDNGSRLLGPVRCATGNTSEIEKTKAWFPGVRTGDFATYLQPNAGHSLQLHYSAFETITKAHEWLRSKGL